MPLNGTWTNRTGDRTVAAEKKGAASAERALELLRQEARQFALRLKQGGKEADQAWRMIHGPLGRWIEGRFRRWRVDQMEAEDLLAEVWVRLLKAPPLDPERAFAVICRTQRTVFIDWLRRRYAGIRDAKRTVVPGADTEDGSEDVLTSLMDQAAFDQSKEQARFADLADCIERKLTLFESINPDRAELLVMMVEGLSYREIAMILFNKEEGEVTKKDEQNVKNRIENARKEGRTYLDQCKE